MCIYVYMYIHRYVGMSMVKRDAAGPLPFHALFAIKYVQKKEDRDASVAATLSLLAARAPLRASAPSLRLFLLLRLPLASPLLRRSLIYSPSEFFTAPTFTGSLCGPRPPQTNSYILPARFSDTMYYRTSFQTAFRVEYLLHDTNSRAHFG